MDGKEPLIHASGFTDFKNEEISSDVDPSMLLFQSMEESTSKTSLEQNVSW